MWVYFNVPEAQYLQYKTELDSNHADHLKIELKLANNKIFPQPGKIGAIEADFNNTTGNISFRADFPNPTGLLRNGQTGTILIHTALDNALIIPQRATYEILAKRYAYVVGEDNIVHQRDITIQTAQDDIFVIESGLQENDRIILEGLRQVKDGDKIEYEFRAPEEVLSHLKYHAE
jgi:membrane fusion protein (multidrug efflux system)